MQSHPEYIVLERQGWMSMAYKRKISYFDLIEDGQKRGNAGFVKWEKYDECHILSICINGLHKGTDREAKVFLGNHELGNLHICNGRSEGTYLLTRDEKDWKEDIENIRIPIDERKVLLAEFEQCEKLNEEDDNDNKVIVMEKKTEVLKEENEKTAERAKQESEESLWEQLGKTHESFYPCDNEGECYRIFPKELKLLKADYHILQNNQFLLHGYYNYRYLIIFPKENAQEKYWIGVPGIYHEREKIAARMFGFEKFEGVKRDYRTGDLGYYLITVE